MWRRAEGSGRSGARPSAGPCGAPSPASLRGAQPAGGGAGLAGAVLLMGLVAVLLPCARAQLSKYRGAGAEAGGRGGLAAGRAGVWEQSFP